jgi:hypothetical protein
MVSRGATKPNASPAPLAARTRAKISAPFACAETIAAVQPKTSATRDGQSHSAQFGETIVMLSLRSGRLRSIIAQRGQTGRKFSHYLENALLMSRIAIMCCT